MAFSLQASYIIKPAPATPIFPSTSTPSFVQSKQNTGALVTTVSASFTALPAVGNVVIVGLGTYTQNAQTMNVTDNQGNPYSRLQLTPNDTTTTVSRGTLWCALVEVSSGTFTVTGTTVINSNPIIFLLEYKNATCNLDRFSSAVTATSPYSCGSITTLNPNDLIIAFLAFAFGGGGTITYTPPTGFTVRESQTNGALISTGSIADNIVSATGTFASTYSTSQNNTSPCLQAALLSH